MSDTPDNSDAPDPARDLRAALELAPRVADPGGWGLVDTETGCWLGLGDAPGPATWPHEDVARLAAQVYAIRLGWGPRRLRVARYGGGAVRRRDEVAARGDPVRILADLEAGRRL